MQVMMKGNEALGEAAVRAGCRYYFGYPITPQTELMEYLARRMPDAGGVFLQAESEVAAINMVYGAAGAGARVLTSSSGPGMSLKQEGISFLACAELPCVIVNVMRGGPGLGGIQPSQADYFQATRGGGHGDYRMPVISPASVQEMVDLTCESFEIAERYRTPVIILTDGVMGQMMEPVLLPDEKTENASRLYITDGCQGRDRRIIKTLYLDADLLEAHNRRLQAKYREISVSEARWDAYNIGDEEVLVVAFGICARVARTAVDSLKEKGLQAGLFRPITLWPFPFDSLRQMAARAKHILVVEMNAGQMLEDVRLALPGREIDFYGRMGGVVVSAREIETEILRLTGGGEK